MNFILNKYSGFKQKIIFLKEYSGHTFELNHFLAQFNEKMNICTKSATAS